MKKIQDYEKVYVLDTNIMLSNAESIITLSQGGTNLIVLPEIVLDEIDSKKSGFDEINFQARKFARLLSEDSKLLKTEKLNTVSTVEIQLKTGEVISIVGKDHYDVSLRDTAPNIINDRKIIEVTEYVRDLYSKFNLQVILLSNDIMMRTRAISKRLDTDFVNDNKKEIDFDFYGEYESEVNVKSGMSLENCIGVVPPSTQWAFHITNTVTGKPFYGIRDNQQILEVDEDQLSRQMARPKNAEQKFMSSLILSSHIDIVVINGNAGTGKNYIATSSAMRLLDTRRDLYSSIIYIRKTVISDDKQGEVGFLPGSLDEKMAGYLAPLYNTLENFVKAQHKDKKLTMSKDEIESAVSNLVAKYDIETKYLGHLRGSTISNAVVIIDEVQNMTKLDLQTTLSRMGKDIKVIVMGSQKQIDNPYLNQYNNALTYLNGLVGDSRNYDMNVKLAGCELEKAVRSEIAEWTDHVF